MKGKLRGLAFLLLALACAPEARAQVEGNPPNWCRNGPFAAEEADYRLARVVGRKGARVYFHGDDEGCPSPKCRLKSYVVPGDEVIVSRTLGDWACAWYQPARGSETVGWIMAHELSLGPPAPKPAAASWEGEWEFYDNGLKVTRDRRTGRLSVKGAASWTGANPGQVHVGEIEAKGTPEGNVLRLKNDECEVTLRLVGPYLLAADNRQCGGLNVTFDGVYRRKLARKRR
ncbi:MAG TPA: hypothetical protein VK422_11670 [Pyrinomonadaceae bacterium]|nr:hypothetical protein [Pyrinomonadaceae bacterium]